MNINIYKHYDQDLDGISRTSERMTYFLLSILSLYVHSILSSDLQQSNGGGNENVNDDDKS